MWVSTLGRTIDLASRLSGGRNGAAPRAGTAVSACDPSIIAAGRTRHVLALDAPLMPNAMAWPFAWNRAPRHRPWRSPRARADLGLSGAHRSQPGPAWTVSPM